MTTGENETHRQKHARLARQLLDQADHTLMTYDLPLTGEKLWHATLHSVKASLRWLAAGNTPAMIVSGYWTS